MFVLALNYLYDDFGARISVHLTGPFAKTTNESSLSRNRISIYTQIGDKEYAPKYFDIAVRTTTGDDDNDQSKLDKVTFDLDVDNAEQLNLSMQFVSNAEDAISLQLHIDTHSVDIQVGAICGGIILILLNVLIISEVKREDTAQYLVYRCNSIHTKCILILITFFVSLNV